MQLTACERPRLIWQVGKWRFGKHTSTGAGQQEVEWTPHLGLLHNTGTPDLTLGSELLLGQATCSGPHWGQLMLETR